MSVIVLGGGLSGLSAAYYLLKRSPNVSVTILEATSRSGGWIRSKELPNGIIFEQGPRTIRPAGIAGANTLQLVEELDLEETVTPILKSHAAATTRLIYANKQLHRLPSNLMSLFVKQSLFSKPIVMYLLKDLVAPRKYNLEQDETIYDFIERRFGTEIADYIISPVICGICAGNAKDISVNFLMKSLFEMEQKYGSITKGLIASAFISKKQQQCGSHLVHKARNNKWSVYSFKNGMEELPNALQRAVIKNGGKIIYNAKCSTIKFDTHKKPIVTLENGTTIEANHVVGSVPSHILAELIRKEHMELFKQLKDIQSVTVAVVNFSFKGKIIDTEAFGFLVPPKENLPILGVIYDSCCFPKGDNTVFTVMMGGVWFKKYFGENPSNKALVNIALKELHTILKFNHKPEYCEINVLRNCIPQYTVGHNKRVDGIFNYIFKNKLQLSLCGSSYYGVGVNDVIFCAKNAVEKIQI